MKKILFLTLIASACALKSGNPFTKEKNNEGKIKRKPSSEVVQQREDLEMPNCGIQEKKQKSTCSVRLATLFHRRKAFKTTSEHDLYTKVSRF